MKGSLLHARVRTSYRTRHVAFPVLTTPATIIFLWYARRLVPYQLRREAYTASRVDDVEFDPLRRMVTACDGPGIVRGRVVRRSSTIDAATWTEAV
jgi:hypothetical protein